MIQGIILFLLCAGLVAWAFMRAAPRDEPTEPPDMRRDRANTTPKHHRTGD